MASGTPVVTSNLSSLTEIAGEAAMLVDPYDVSAIAGGIRRVLTDTRLADELRRKGLLRAREFSWPVAVTRTQAIYQQFARMEAR